MRIPISSMKAGLIAEWPMTYDRAEEILLMSLYREGRIDIGMIDSKAARDKRDETAGWRDIDSVDALRAARCRGYTAGLKWQTEAEHS